MSKNNFQAKFMTPSNSPGRSIRLCVHHQVPDQNGLPVSLFESVNSRNLPALRAQLFLESTPNGEKKWFSLSAPLRKVDENGFYILKARTNESGAFLNRKGEVVSSEKEAAKMFQYERDDQGKVIWGTIATLNVKNLNKDNQPLKGTMLSAKLFTDKEAKAIHDEVRRIKQLPQDARGPEYENLGKLKSNSGEWTNMFIREGHDLIRSFGFECREMPSQNLENQAPGNEFNDDIPF
ncbi:hypothetical protein [Vibrio harveyi]|uniref:hypothetical protein n=1 Tax=Vibrio harveyi TaxID=669 RepID=UPI003CF8865F